MPIGELSELRDVRLAPSRLYVGAARVEPAGGRRVCRAGQVARQEDRLALPLDLGIGDRNRRKQRDRVRMERIVVDAAERKEILSRYVDHSRRFDEVAAKRGQGNAEVIPFAAPLRELEQEPTAREVEVLQLISEGLVNREIGHRLFLSEETVKSHVRHLLAKLQARSRAHAVAVGFRRDIIA